MPALRSNLLRPADGQVLDDAGFGRLLRRASTTLIFALLAPTLLLLGLALFLVRSAHWVDHTDQVISEANHVETLLVTMQSGFRGFRLMHEETLLVPLAAAQKEINPRLRSLAELVADNPLQVALVVQIEAAANAWMKVANETLARLAAGETEEAQRPYVIPARETFNVAIARVHGLVERENRLRLDRSRLLDRVVTGLVLALGAAALLGVPLASRWLRRSLRDASTSYRASLVAAERRARELHVTLQSIGDAVIATDAAGRVDFLNAAAEKLLGWSQAEAHGRELAEVFVIFNEQTRAPTPNPVARVLRENIVIGLANHTVLRARDGRECPIEDSAAPIRDDRGAVLGVILVFHDVSEQRGNERRLHDSEWRLRFLNDLGEATRPLAAPAEIMAVSSRMLGQYLRASRCAYAEVATDQERFTIVEDYTDGCASSRGDYRLSDFGATAAGKMRTGDALVIRNLDTETAFADGAAAFDAIGIKAIVCFPLLKDSRLSAMMAVHQTTPRDWTAAEVELIAEVVERCWATIERARAEVAFRRVHAQAETEARGAAESAERFRVLSEVVALQVWTADAQGALDYANQECVAYFGGDLARDILGHAWSQYVHPDDLPVALRAWQASLASGESYEVEFRLRGKDGVFRWFLARAQALRNPAGGISKWFGSNTDIDELKRAQDAAERGSRAKDDFLAALSHELRTPLTPVLMSAATLREDERLPPDVREQLGMMERNIALEARLIDDLLDLTTLSRGKLQLRAQPCDAHSLIGLAIEIVRADATAKSISIERAFTPGPSGLLADPARFQQVIWNLLRNAVKFTPAGGRISIRTAAMQSGGAAGLRIEVADSGIGIEPAQLDRIFLPFDQGGLTGDHRFGGMGLGLAIARAVVELHGGRITAHSAGAGQGATFVVELPGLLATPSGLQPAPTTPDLPRSAPLRLLLVEDHASTLETLTRLLTRDGHSVVPAASITEALAAAAAGSFDLVISDLGLPDGSGLELMEKLRARYRLRGIALSGYGMEEDLAHSTAAGFIMHLVKPVHFGELRRALATLPAA